jgi:hypothetical protein
MHGIGSVTIKEMLGVVHHLRMPRQILDTLSDHREILFETDS